MKIQRCRSSAGPGAVKRMQASFRIFTELTPGPAGEVASPGGEGASVALAPASGSEKGLTKAQRTAAALLIGSAGLIVCAFVLAVTSLRRRMNDRAGRPDRTRPVR